MCLLAVNFIYPETTATKISFSHSQESFRHLPSPIHLNPTSGTNFPSVSHPRLQTLQSEPIGWTADDWTRCRCTNLLHIRLNLKTKREKINELAIFAQPLKFAMTTCHEMLKFVRTTCRGMLKFTRTTCKEKHVPSVFLVT